MLHEIMSLLDRHGRLSLRDIASLLKAEVSAVEPMLDLLVEKHRARRCAPLCVPRWLSCAACSCAAREDMAIFEGVERSPRQEGRPPWPGQT
jgi:hypothetical protein